MPNPDNSGLSGAVCCVGVVDQTQLPTTPVPVRVLRQRAAHMTTVAQGAFRHFVHSVDVTNGTSLSDAQVTRAFLISLSRSF